MGPFTVYNKDNVDAGGAAQALTSKRSRPSPASRST